MTESKSATSKNLSNDGWVGTGRLYMLDKKNRRVVEIEGNREAKTIKKERGEDRSVGNRQGVYEEKGGEET